MVPPGSGTVDLRVQSGVVVADPRNINDPIYGYGLSAPTAAARFTYGGSPVNQPPTVARPASATPGRVVGTSTTLSVLGADDGGESSLIYTWQVLTAPPGARPSFRINGSSAARTTVVDFDRAGEYAFRVTITDAHGLSVTSDTSASVGQTLLAIVVSPSSAILRNRGRLQFTAEAFDQFAAPLSVQPAFSWTKRRGAGTISRTGLYSAPAAGRGTVVIQAAAGGKTGLATVRLVALPRAARPGRAGISGMAAGDPRAVQAAERSS